MIKNYGFKLKVIDPRSYRLGSIELPKVVLRPDGQWHDYLPNEEVQHAPSYETYGCTIYGTENIQQILEKFHYGKTSEYAERYNYNLIKIVPPGADPHEAAESFRNDGVISYEELPMVSTLEEYASPRPVSQSLISKGVAHPYELRHQWLWYSSQNKETRTRLIKEYLKYSPLAVSCTAWMLKDGVYVDNGQRNTHWTVLYGWNDKGWLIFDSYAPHRKILSYDHNIETCKRFQLVSSTRQARLTIMGSIVKLLQKIFNLLAPADPSLSIFDVPEPALPTSEPLLSTPSVIELAEAIKAYEGWFPPSPTHPNGSVSWKNKNPGNIKDRYGKFLVFPNEKLGMNYLLDYIRRVQKNEHKAYPKDVDLYGFFRVYAPVADSNFPKTYAIWVAHRLGVTPDVKLKTLV